MVLERAMNDDFLSCTYLVGDGERAACFVDAGGPVDGLIAHARDTGVDVTHVLLTHHHFDHVSQLPQVTEAFPDAEVLIHPSERDLVEGATGTLGDGDTVEVGGLTVRAIHTPGHTKGMLALVAGDDVFTGDTLFKGSVGGVRAPGSTSYEDLRGSIMDKLMALDHGLTVRPGHTDPTTIGHEWEHNPFIRLWRGLDEEGDDEVIVFGSDPARLVLLGPDYDGGHKAWVRWPDGRDDIVPGSQVKRPD